jgi:hypothetical protein
MLTLGGLIRPAPGWVSVLLLDFRGYGGNPGDPTEDGLALECGRRGAIWSRT